VATRRWETTFDLIGFAAYYTLMTGEFPDDDLMETARFGTGPRLVELPQKKAPRATKKTEIVAA
jgi:hypothetical protein